LSEANIRRLEGELNSRLSIPLWKERDKDRCSDNCHFSPNKASRPGLVTGSQRRGAVEADSGDPA